MKTCLRTLAALLVAALLAPSVYAQKANGIRPSGPVTLQAEKPADDAGGISALADNSRVNPAFDDLLREVQALRNEVRALQLTIDTTQTNSQAMQDALAKQLDINDRIQQQLSELSNRVELVARGGGNSSGGTDFVRSIQDDPQLRGDFQKVVQGKVIFENQTGQAQRVFINGAEWEVIPGRSSMYVPYGLVTIHTRLGADGSLTPFTVDNWTKEGDQLVLNVPLQLAPER